MGCRRPARGSASPSIVSRQTSHTYHSRFLSPSFPLSTVDRGDREATEFSRRRFSRPLSLVGPGAVGEGRGVELPARSVYS